MRRIVLASSSPFRKALLERFGLPFETASPAIEERPRQGESPADMVLRLAEAKARAVADGFPDALIIASDQCAVVGETAVGKPGNFERAFEQLKRVAGKPVVFHTGLCLLDAVQNRYEVDDVVFKVYFRPLSDKQIRRYLERETPYDCAGSFKAEGLGIALFERMEGDDPNALIGLPLIRLVSMLQEAGIDII